MEQLNREQLFLLANRIINSEGETAEENDAFSDLFPASVPAPNKILFSRFSVVT
ncbi:hypothetical protein [Niabella beijingensis]|uniref:hypothetical protein n=1 Tax=Niabella beijingensis TaxID=2872700 RepID=UPI001CBB4AB9|nr:hypothetical protein [Niabella beijingensis]MBZ4192596.1 hypothetical protein [Niabella beijingensis]